MMYCPQCQGNGYLQHGQRMTSGAPGAAPSFMFYGDNKQWPETTCPTCLGIGYFTGAGS